MLKIIPGHRPAEVRAVASGGGHGGQAGGGGGPSSAELKSAHCSVRRAKKLKMSQIFLPV